MLKSQQINRKPTGYIWREYRNTQHFEGWLDWQYCNAEQVAEIQQRYDGYGKVEFVEVFANAPATSNNAETALSKVMAIHSTMLANNPYCYFELAYTRHTDYMVWICSNQREQDPNRKVILCGQGATVEDACADGLAKYNGESHE